MEAEPTISRRFALRRPSRQFRPEAVHAPPRLGTLAGQALWLGLASTGLEVGIALGHRTLVGTVTKVSVSFSRYFLPLSLVAHLAIFAGWFALAVAVRSARGRAPRSDATMTWLGLFLAVLSPLLFLEELAWWSSAIVAAGLSMRLTPWWLRRRGAILRRTLAPMCAASVLLAGLGFAWIHTAERRALAALPPAAPDAPNVVMIVLDTVRADHLSLYGYHRRTTPKLESLAGRGVRFDFARAPSSWTLPSHATMFTGRWPHELSVDIDRPLDGTFPTLAEFLSGRGYRTGGFVGNTFYCNGWFGLDRGFAHYDDTDENREVSVQQTLRSAALGRTLMPLAVQLGLWPTIGQYPERKTAEEVNGDALAWLDRGGSRPFFLFLNYIDAHGPYTIPDDFPREFSNASREELIAANTNARRKGGDKRLSAAERDAVFAEVGRIGFDAYDDCLRYVDDQIARLLAELDRRGVGENTWVIVTADHGEHFGEHGKYWHGSTLYRPVVDVPLLIVPPSGMAPRRVPVPVSPRDLPATIADVLGLDEDSPFPGNSLRRHWDDTVAAPTVAEPTISELKLRAGEDPAAGPSAKEQFRASLVDRDTIYHRSPIGPEEMYDVADGREERDLTPLPGADSKLDAFRNYINKLLMD